MSYHRILWITGLLFPFLHLEIFLGVKILYIVIVILLITNCRPTIDKTGVLIIFWASAVLISYLHGQIEYGYSEHAFKITLSLLVATLLAALVRIDSQITLQRYFISGYIGGFLVNSLLNIYKYVSSGGAVSRISSWTSVGYSDGGIEHLATQASFNEIGALSAVAVLFQIIKVFNDSSRRLLFVTIYNQLVLVVLLAGVMLTGSRSAALGIVLAVIYIALGNGRPKFTVLFLVLVPTALVVLLGGDILLSRTMSLYSEQESVDAISAYSRILAWVDAMNIFLSAPIFGVGYGYYPSASAYAFLTTESYYMTLLAETGSLGVLIFLYLTGNSIRISRLALKRQNASQLRRYHLEKIAGLIILLTANLTGSIMIDFTIYWLFLMLVVAKYQNFTAIRMSYSTQKTK